MWLREHRSPTCLVLLLLVLGTLSVLGVGNNGVPWSWVSGAANARGVGTEAERGIRFVVAAALILVGLPPPRPSRFVSCAMGAVSLRLFGRRLPFLAADGFRSPAECGRLPRPRSGTPDSSSDSISGWCNDLEGVSKATREVRGLLGRLARVVY
jgi:hypothetical protein